MSGPACVIWRFPFELGNVKAVSAHEVAVAMPRDAAVLSAGVQAKLAGTKGPDGKLEHIVTVETLNLWAMVNPEAEPVTRRFVVLETGQPVAPHLIRGARFVATVLGVAGRNVWHVFEVNVDAPEAPR